MLNFSQFVTIAHSKIFLRYSYAFYALTTFPGTMKDGVLSQEVLMFYYQF